MAWRRLSKVEGTSRLMILIRTLNGTTIQEDPELQNGLQLLSRRTIMSIGSQALRRLGTIFIIAGTCLLAARPASALWETHTSWYSDATLSTLVGEEYNNGCTGYVSSWGVVTQYHTQERTNCGPPSGCPILIDLENDGIRLTGLADPVWFDIDADGDADLISWTERSEGILALDRNGNGTIDNGGELFGNATLLADGTRALNGYLALAELDSWAFGGNGDEFIDSADAVFGSLRLWTDRDHDGISQPEELRTLAETSIRRIEVNYRRSHRTDRYGNEFRFLGRAWKAGDNGVLHPLLTWDVFFLVEP
jgi:hypothetical protein